MSQERDDFISAWTKAEFERRGESVETTGRRWAQNRAELMRAGIQRSVLIVRRTKEYDRRRSLKTLTGEEETVWNSVWFDEVGNLYISRWPIKKTGYDEKGRRFLVNPKGYNYEVLNRDRIRDDLFVNLPKRIPVREVIIDEVDTDIETAVRKARKVLKKYQPGTEAYEVSLARQVIEHTDRLAHRFIEGRITKTDLEALAVETGAFLEEVELVNPQDPDKQTMLNELLEVTLTDKLGRVNPLVARVRARAAYLAAARRLVVGGMVVKKFATIEQIMLYERETTRWSIETAANQLENLLGHADFRRPDGVATKLQRAAIVNILFDISEHHLSMPRVKPYLEHSRYAAINLIGCREFLKDENRKILGEEVADVLFERVPTRTLIMEGRFSEARERILESIAVINFPLKKYESIEKTA